MKNAVRTAIDRSGRLVLPKAIREEAGIRPGMKLEITISDGTVEISPAPRRVRIAPKGKLKVAFPEEKAEPLTKEDVRRVQRAVRRRR